MECLNELLSFNNNKCAENLQQPVRSVIFNIFMPLEIKPSKTPQLELYSLCKQKNDTVRITTVPTKTKILRVSIFIVAPCIS